MPKSVLNIHHKIFIREKYLKASGNVIAKHLSCDSGVVNRYKKRAKLFVPKELSKKFKKDALIGKTIFTWQMDKMLRENYLEIPEKPLALQLGVSSTCLRIRMRQLSLSVPKEIIESRKELGRFKKGHVTHNKGKNLEDFLTTDQIKKLKKTQFKKGNKPHNTVKGIGAIRIRKESKTGLCYKYIKLADNNWQLLSRVNWEKENGPIPDGYLIVFKDGNTMDCSPSNLECISMRENALRNTLNFHSLPEPLKKAIKLNNKLKKAIQ